MSFLIKGECLEVTLTVRKHSIPHSELAIQVFRLSKNVLTNPAGIWSRYYSHSSLVHFVVSISLLCSKFKNLLERKHSLHVTEV